jgi:hypothetical protein
MRVLLAAIVGGIAMYVWATAAHLSPLGGVGAHPMPNEGLIAAALKLNLGDKGGVYIYPGPAAAGAPAGNGPVAEGMLAYNPNGTGALRPSQLGIEFGLEMFEALMMACIAALAAVGLGRRIAIATLVGLIAGITTNLSYWNWYGFGLDYTLTNGFIELVKYLVAGVAIALMLGRPKAA